jgi:MurNAc alpha-1-phosphate uridylyltransferase
MQKVTNAMIYAAGFGTRMAPLTDDKPKPLISVAGRALLDHALDFANDLDCTVNAHYHADQIKAHVAKRPNVAFIHETPDILETGGGLRNALPVLGDAPVFTMNSDAVWKGPNPFEVLQQHWRPEKMDALLLVIPLDCAVAHTGSGDFDLGTDGQLSRGGEMVYTGAQITKTDGLKLISETAFSLNLLWHEMAKVNRLFGVKYQGQWADVGRPESIQKAERMLGYV